MSYPIWLSPVVSFMGVIVSMVAYVLSRNANVSAKRPVLVFVYEHEQGWILKNVGNGPALNVCVAQKLPGTGEQWFKFVRIPPLAKDKEFVLRYLNHVNTTALAATCDDMENRAYSSLCRRDLTTLSKGRLFSPQESEIVQVWKVESERPPSKGKDS